MKTISLKGMSNPLNEGEMKKVKGGTPLTLIDDPGEGDLIADGDGTPKLSPKQEACKGKKIGDPCSFKDDRGVTQYGKCQRFYDRPLHCSDLN